MCFDEGLLTPKTVMTDVAVNYEGYTPENYDSRFNGYVTVEYALGQSLNVPAVKGLRMLGHEKFIQALSRAGFRQVQQDRRKLGLSMILGGCGATLEELTGLFSAFANNGTYVPPVFTRDETPPAGKELVSPAAAFMITTVLSDIHRPDFPLNWSATEKMPRIAWKTGTSYGRRDGWSIGYNKRFTVGVWTGNFSGKGVAALSGAQVATPLLFRIFNTIDYDSDESWYAQPPGCDIRKVCHETGLVPGEQCTTQVTDYFIPLVSSTQVCNNRQEVLLTPDGKMSYCRTCAPATGYRKKWFRTIEPGMQAWMEENQVNFEAIPAHNPDCEVVFRGAAPVIQFPVNGTEYLLSKNDPEPLQLVAKTTNEAGKLFWYINDRFYRSTLPGEKQFFLPPEGSVKISCTDDKGRNRNIRITVKYVDL
jgi:penicillin-binding protein 1C